MSGKEEGKEFDVFQQLSAADIDKADEAEAMTAAQATARHRLSERIERWERRTVENVGDDIKTTFSLTDAARLEKKACALVKEYNAVVDAHKKLFANRYRYTDEKGLPSYFYKYPTDRLFFSSPSTKILVELFKAASETYQRSGAGPAGFEKCILKANEMEDCRRKYSSARRDQYYEHEQLLPPTAVLCPEPLVSEEEEEDTKSKSTCAFQGGGKKSKSKYSRKSKTKYSRKSKSKSKYSRKSKSKYSRKY